MVFIEAIGLDNFKEWVSEMIEDIKNKRFEVIITRNNEIFIIPQVTTSGLKKPFITGLSDQEIGEMKKWFRERGIPFKECKHIFIDDREDPRKIKREE